MLCSDYDLWVCARCGRQSVIPSRPHKAPRCCDTGMLWKQFLIGEPYNWPVRAEDTAPGKLL